MKYYILDLSPENSLVRYLVERGHTVFVVSWHNPDEGDRDLGLEDYRTLGIEAALDAVSAVVPDQRVHAVGYCLGGTWMSIAAAGVGPGRGQAAGQSDVVRHAGRLHRGGRDGLERRWDAPALSHALGEPAVAVPGQRPGAGPVPRRWTADLVDRHQRSDLLGRETERDHVCPWRSVYKLGMLADAEVTFLPDERGPQRRDRQPARAPTPQLPGGHAPGGRAPVGPGHLATGHAGAHRLVVAVLAGMAGRAVRAVGRATDPGRTRGRIPGPRRGARHLRPKGSESPVSVDPRPVRALLVDGTIIRVRALDEADAQLVAAFYRELPVRDRYLRFFSAGALPPAEDLIASRGPTDLSLGAFRGEELIGVAQCYGTRTDPLTAEVALAVAHGEQTLGVGTLLLEHLASRARRSGVRRFVADVLPENDRVRQVLTDVGLPVWRSGDGGEVSVELDLAPAGGYPAALAAREERADIAQPGCGPRAAVGAGRGCGPRVGLGGPRRTAQRGPGRFPRSPRRGEPACDAGVRRRLPPVGGRADRAGRPRGALRSLVGGTEGGRAVRAQGGARHCW